MIKKLTTLLVVAITAISFSSIAAAQGDPSQTQQKAQKLQQEYQQTAARLQKIHDETLEENDALNKEQEDFIKQVRAEIKNQGYDLDKGSERVQNLTKKLQSDDLDDDERQSLMEDFRAEREDMSKAREAALNKPKIKKAGEKLQKDTLEAMKKHDSDTEKLIKKMDDLREKLTKLMQQNGGGAPQQ